MLLVVPGIFAALIIRPGEHPLATSVLLGVRILVVAAAFCAFVATAYIATGFGSQALHRHLVPLTWATACVLVLLLISLALPRGAWKL